MSDITPNTYFKLSLRDWIVVLIAVGGWTWGLINQNKVIAKGENTVYVSKTDFDLTKAYFDERITDTNINYWKIERKLENMEKIQETRHAELLKAIFK